MTIMGHGSLEIVLQYYHTTAEHIGQEVANVSFESMLGPDKDPAVGKWLSRELADRGIRGLQDCWQTS
ncbi:MAG: hypothetical protein WD042_17470 [Phycisphaeraceae bacterium]